MSRKFLIPLLAVMLLGAPFAFSGSAHAFSKYLDQATPLKIANPLVGTTGRTSTIVKGLHKSPIHKGAISDNESPRPTDR
ncbi:MAG: hypothetical protein ABSC25_15380 [Roseiarcus sp.]|jgi:hypothetical protein